MQRQHPRAATGGDMPGTELPLCLFPERETSSGAEFYIRLNILPASGEPDRSMPARGLATVENVQRNFILRDTR